MIERGYKRTIPFTTLQNIEKQRRKKPIILFGAGRTAEKTIRLLRSIKVKSIVDNSLNLWGEIQDNIEIKNPKTLLDKENKQAYIIICTTSFAQVSAQLEKMGFKPEIDFCVSPILNDLRIIDELETIEKTMLFTSGSPRQNSQFYGGGVYELNVKGDAWKHKKVINGNCYGMINYGDNFISVDTERGIFEFDREYKILRQKELPHGIRAHGVDYNKQTDSFYVTGSYLDGVLVLDKEFNIKDKILISNKREYYGSPQHHCNDCFTAGYSLYVSMFSFTGNWKLDIFDGVVLEIDLKTKKVIGPVISDLWMPHNICIIGGSLTVMDSLRGHLKKNNAQIVGEFPAFSRGLAFDGVYHYIGQSRNRNFSKNLGLSKNISIDAGVIIWDEHTKVSRFLQLPPKLSEIHSIVLLD